MPASATTTASLAFASRVRAGANIVGNPRLAKDLEDDGTNAALRAAMLAAGIAADHATVVGLDAATVALDSAIDAGNNPRFLQTLSGTHADAITAAANALIAVP